MHSLRRQRLQLVIGGLLLVALGLTAILYALSDNLNVFYTPSEIQVGEAEGSHTIRVGGLVENNSVIRGSGVQVYFGITDTNKVVKVVYKGILPDLFREGEGVVAIGSLDDNGVLVATEVLAKHDENYMPPEAMEAIKRSAQLHSQ